MRHKENISFRLVAYTDAAGKYTPEAFRGGNEDNFYVDDDLTDDTTNQVAQDEIIQLGRLGMIMVVADGMGGMNAGEIASQITIDTIKASFRKNAIKPSILSNVQSRQKYLECVIKNADKKIKLEARKNPDKEGMGSTIIIGWMYEDELTISWCGDSRAYLFNEKSGLRLISQDHSYVQELVNKGLLTYDQTFDHPQNNIITRSLGDPTKDARPESKTIKVGKGDVILLCSDGLSGVLRDRQVFDTNGHALPEENIEDIIKSNIVSMKQCREALWEAAERNGWYDNVTAILCQITDGPESVWASNPNLINDQNNIGNRKNRLKFVCLAIIIIGAMMGAFFLGRNSQNKTTEIIESSDSTKEEIPSLDNMTTLVPAENEEMKDVKSDYIEGKTTVQERIKKQNEEKIDSVPQPNGLTKIERNKEPGKETSNSKNQLTPIKDNPIDPMTYKKDNPYSNPKNKE